GTYPNYSIDYEKSLLSRGNLTGPMDAKANSANPGSIDFDWTDNSGSGNAQATDKAMLVVYNPTKKEAIYTTAGEDRVRGTQSLTIPAEYSGDTVSTYMAFISEDGKNVSNSVFIDAI